MLMLIFSDALSTYAGQEASVRDQLDSILTREEDQYELNIRRRSSSSRGYSQGGTRRSSTDSQDHNASFYEYKRRVLKTAMGLKFGGLQTLCNKGLVRRILCGILKASHIFVNRL